LSSASLAEALRVTHPLPVKIWEGYTFYILSVRELENKVTGKFLPCAKNSREYTLPISDVHALIPVDSEGLPCK